MAHLLTTKNKTVPLVFNVDGPVGNNPAQNIKEDVELVQFLLKCYANSPSSLSAGDKSLLASLKCTGSMDAFTSLAIQAVQNHLKKTNPGTVVDGRVSPVTNISGSYGLDLWTIVALNHGAKKSDPEKWPRLDKFNGCPQRVAELVRRSIIGS